MLRTPAAANARSTCTVCASTSSVAIASRMPSAPITAARAYSSPIARLRRTPGHWRLYLRLFDGSHRLLAFTVVVSIAQALLLVPIATLAQRAFDREIPRGHAGAVAVVALLMLALYVASTALSLVTRWVTLKVTKEAIARLRVQLAERLLRLSRAELDRSSVTELQSIVVQDSERVDNMSNTVIAVLLPAAIVTVGLSIVALVLSPLLFATVLAIVPVLVVVNRVFARNIGPRTRRWQRAFDAFASGTALGLRAMPLTKIHAAEEVEIERQSRTAWELSGAGWAVAWATGSYSIVQGAVSGCAGVLVLIVGGWSASHGHTSIGD